MYFQIADFCPPVEGVDLGGRWNGARRPSFPKASADAIVEAHNEYYEGEAEKEDAGPGPDGAYAWYDEVTKAYHFHTPHSGETDVFHPASMAEVCELAPHWRIGTDSWTWEAAPVTRLVLTFDVVGVDEESLSDRVNGLLDDGTIQQGIDPDCEWTFLRSDAATEVLP
jgi:hypothetical protein